MSEYRPHLSHLFILSVAQEPGVERPQRRPCPGRRYEDVVIVLLTIVAQYAVYSERPVNGSRCREGTSVMARAEQLTCGNPATHHHHLQRRGLCGAAPSIFQGASRHPAPRLNLTMATSAVYQHTRSSCWGLGGGDVAENRRKTFIYRWVVCFRRPGTAV